MRGSFEDHEFAPDVLGECCTTGKRIDRVARPVDHEHRAADAPTEPARLLRREPLCVLGGDHRLGVCLQPPADSVLDRLRRVRLREHLRDEELDPVAVVAEPVEPVVLRPAVVRVVLGIEVVDGSLRERLTAAHE
jgi:hypothetical protein